VTGTVVPTATLAPSVGLVNETLTRGGVGVGVAAGVGVGAGVAVGTGVGVGAALTVMETLALER
jgi:hypothetical protein